MFTRPRVAMVAAIALLLSFLSPLGAWAAEGHPTARNVAASERASARIADPAPAGDSVWRFYSPSVRGHFYTMSPTERDRLISDSTDGWRYEGQGFTAYRTQIQGTIPLFRFYATAQKAHFFTTSVTERDRLRNTDSGWRYEGIAFYVWPDTQRAETVEMARFWNFKSRRHFYTASPTERDRVLASLGDTWRYEGSNFAVPAGGVGAKIPPPNPGDTKNCGDFRNYAHAKAWFDLHYPHYQDVARLDQNGDMIPCETLPGAP